MATDREINYISVSHYLKMLDILKSTRLTNPEAYDVAAAMVREYREWVTMVAGLKDLPEVPAK